jgi:ubiquitin
MEEQKNKLTDELSMKSKELKKNNESSSDVQRKFDQLQKKYDQECITMKQA